MTTTRALRAYLALAALLSTVDISTAEEAKPAAAEKTEKKPAVEDELSVTRHRLTLGGEAIAYTATAGTLVIQDDAGEPRASVFHVAYVRDGREPATRPVTFSFNGGPGAAAVWVHLGAFGPKKVRMDPEGMALPPPGELVENPYSLLDVSDLVFIDPVSTGWSRPAPGVDAKQFHTIDGDVESVAELIRLWLTRNGRWASPKFLAGESYGTTRAAGLALHLQDRYGIYLNGVVMISTVLNWLNQEPDIGNDLPYIIHLPTYAATARYHGKVEADDLEAFLTEVEHFALTDYALALHQGHLLDAASERRIAEQVARYAGLSVDFVLGANLRVGPIRFLKELLRAEGKTVGRLDSRFTGWDRDTVGEFFEYDPSMEAVSIGYVALLNDYLRRELGYETDRVLEPLNFEVFPWKWDDYQNRYVNVAENLRQAMTRNPELRVLFTSGYYDFATPYFDTEYTVNHLDLPAALRSNVEITYYEAGHMMYIREVDHAKFKRDVAGFIRRASAPRREPAPTE